MLQSLLVTINIDVNNDTKLEEWGSKGHEETLIHVTFISHKVKSELVQFRDILINCKKHCLPAG
jgi:hypothetical protein